ncbi:hypothetical protein DFR50_102224 [Roseiarcus fermentans]|uniref:Glycosyl transferase family 2 n=1 Tax=Roseiarcus fermentans TaxID=1473586 RepID=A0A366FT73_9HYPH|nr:hypothetical protein [Roseiarcus fermentans]RBP17731.1 hypothetical protein DFR50_102224 [Roseiarcus fermentans]
MALFGSPLARRAFWPRAYARRRFGSERAAALAPLHYALAGEAMGFRPNGFFDPRFYRERAGLGARVGGLLDHYLARTSVEPLPPSPQFDPAWYVAENPDWRVTHPHPFLHFLEIGLASGRRPRADIDMAFVRDAIRGRGRSIEEAAMRVFDPKPHDGDMDPPLCREELFARQQRFYAASRLRIERQAAAGGRDRLVFVQCGRDFDPPWLEGPRGFDALLNYFEEAETDARAETVVVQTGTKTTAIRRLLAERPDLLLGHRAVLFLDDDVETSASDIDALFSAFEGSRLDLAQPALTADSESAFGFLKRPEAPQAMFRVSSVEIMAPIMSRRALEAAGWTFSETVSGWGTDLLLGPAVRAAFGPGSVGVVGSVAVRHARKVDLGGGAFYAYLRRYGIDPAHEANRVAADFGVDRHLRRLEAGEAGPTAARRSVVSNAGGERG